ncbi:MAG: hypothetical protein ACPGLV_04905 [Bacteroidia bacterium]
MKTQKIIITLTLAAVTFLVSCNTDSVESNLNTEFRALYAEQVATDSAVTDTITSYCDSLEVLLKSKELTKYEAHKIKKLFKHKCIADSICKKDGKRPHKKGPKKGGKKDCKKE